MADKSPHRRANSHARFKFRCSLEFWPEGGATLTVLSRKLIYSSYLSTPIADQPMTRQHQNAEKRELQDEFFVSESLLLKYQELLTFEGFITQPQKKISRERYLWQQKVFLKNDWVLHPPRMAVNGRTNRRKIPLYFGLHCCNLWSHRPILRHLR